jgi:lactoylglutathione lyase
MSEFASTTINVGIVVSNVERSVAFYRNALGFTEVQGFDVPASLGGDSGLSDYKPFHVHVLKLADTRNATEIKLMEFPGTPSERPNNEFIHSTLGMRYLTILVKDMTAAVERAKKAGAAPIAKGPAALPPDLAKGVYLTVIRDPDGNMIELVGPKK